MHGVGVGAANTNRRDSPKSNQAQQGKQTGQGNSGHIEHDSLLSPFVVPSMLYKAVSIPRCAHLHLTDLKVSIVSS